MVRIIFLVVLISFSGGLQQAEAMVKKEAFFETFDLLALPGERVKLKFRLFDKTSFFPYNNPLKEEVVGLYKEGKLIDSAVLKDENGMQYFEVQVPIEEGIVVFEIKTSIVSSYSAKAFFTINVVKKCSPILISDIDLTIANISTLKYLFVDYEDIPPMAGSVDALRTLAEKFTIIYLTARNEVLMQSTKKWLKLYKYVKGPSYFWSYTHHPFFSSEYKTSIIKKLREKHSNIIVGIGDKLSDIEAYFNNGMRAYHLSENRPKNMVKKQNIFWVKSWKKIVEDLQENSFDEKDLRRRCIN